MTGKLLDSFTLTVDGQDVAAEIRLVIADNGTEMLYHYENGRHILAHPAKRCNTCNEIITACHFGGSCANCTTELHLG